MSYMMVMTMIKLEQTLIELGLEGKTQIDNLQQAYDEMKKDLKVLKNVNEP